MFNIEVTDTFDGDANYCWVLRGQTRATTRRGVVAAIKRLARWHGVRVNVEEYGDSFTVRPCATTGICQVGFAYWVDR